MPVPLREGKPRLALRAMDNGRQRLSEGALVLGLETSCDETAAAVVERTPDGQGRILSNVVRTQWERHRPYGGVVPEIAARAHVECLDILTREAMREAGVGFERSRRGGGDGRARPDRRPHRGARHGQGDGAGRPAPASSPCITWRRTR